MIWSFENKRKKQWVTNSILQLALCWPRSTDNELQAVHSLIPCNNCKLTVNKQVTMTIITIIITVQMITKFQEGTHLPTWSPSQYIQTRCMYQRNPLICFPTYCTWYIICYHFFFHAFLNTIYNYTYRKKDPQEVDWNKMHIWQFPNKINKIVSCCKVNTRQQQTSIHLYILHVQITPICITKLMMLSHKSTCSNYMYLQKYMYLHHKFNDVIPQYLQIWHRITRIRHWLQSHI